MKSNRYEFPPIPDDVRAAMLKVVEYLREVVPEQPPKVAQLSWNTISMLETVTLTGPFHTKEGNDEDS
jgi:hypothetical protein